MKKHKSLPFLYCASKDDIYVDTIFHERLDDSLEHNFYIEKYTPPEKFWLSIGSLKLFKKKTKSYFKLFFCKKFNYWNSSEIPLDGFAAYDKLAWIQVAQWPANIDNSLLYLETSINLFANDSNHADRWITELRSCLIIQSF